MSTSVGTKAKKKQPALLKNAPPPSPSQAAVQREKALETAMLSLETACLMVMESEFAPPSSDESCQTARQRFINVAAPVSLALRECKGGPRHFHQHYRHKIGDDTILQPILEDPVEDLLLACREAARHCHEELLGLRDPGLRQTRAAFQRALNEFITLAAPEN